MNRIRIVFADDHEIVRRGLRALFESVKDFSVVGEASDGAMAIELIAEHKPNVAVLDISMPNLNGVEATKIIRKRFPFVKVLILTIHEDEEYVYRLLRAGANGYVLKNAEKNEIVAGIRSVSADGAFFSPGVSRMMIDTFVEMARAEGEEEGVNALQLLTKRETEILRLISRGLTTKEIARNLALVVNTVQVHLEHIMEKLDIHDPARLFHFSVERGIGAPQSSRKRKFS